MDCHQTGVCIVIVDILFGVASGQVSSIFDRGICLTQSICLFPDNKEKISMDIYQTQDMF